MLVQWCICANVDGEMYSSSCLSLLAQVFFLTSMTAPPRVTLLRETCTWTLQRDTGSKVILTLELRDNLTQQICQSLNCGPVSSIGESRASPNSTCLSHCLHVNRSGLGNCAEVVGNGCKVLSKVICGKTTSSDRFLRVTQTDTYHIIYHA